MKIKAPSRREILKYGLASCAAAGLTRPSKMLGATDETIPLNAGLSSTALLPLQYPETKLWTYNGETPGRLIRLQQGQLAKVELRNGLPQPTSVHWHGLRIPNAMDGVSGLTQEPVKPGDAMTYEFRALDAGTFWYHTHNKSWEQLARGLYGPIVVDENKPIIVDQDLVLVLDDWRLGQDGQIDEASFGNMHDWAHGGRLGNWITVNGKRNPDLPVKRGERLRLRLINAANAKVFQLGLSELVPFVVAVDGQPVLPRRLRQVDSLLSPGQRIDLIVDVPVSRNEDMVITTASQKGQMPLAHFKIDRDTVVRQKPLDSSIRLAPNDLPQHLDLVTSAVAELHMEGGAMGGLRGATLNGERKSMRELVSLGYVWAFNGAVELPNRPLLSVRTGKTAIVRMINDNRWPHAMHLHGHHFKVIERNSNKIAKADWRDTELVMPGETLAFAFEGGEPGKWLLHCHMLEHQAAGMKTWIEVT